MSSANIHRLSKDEILRVTPHGTETNTNAIYQLAAALNASLRRVNSYGEGGDKQPPIQIHRQRSASGGGGSQVVAASTAAASKSNPTSSGKQQQAPPPPSIDNPAKSKQKSEGGDTDRRKPKEAPMPSAVEVKRSGKKNVRVRYAGYIHFSDKEGGEAKFQQTDNTQFRPIRHQHPRSTGGKHKLPVGDAVQHDGGKSRKKKTQRYRIRFYYDDDGQAAGSPEITFVQADKREAVAPDNSQLKDLKPVLDSIVKQLVAEYNNKKCEGELGEQEMAAAVNSPDVINTAGSPVKIRRTNNKQAVREDRKAPDGMSFHQRSDSKNRMIRVESCESEKGDTDNTLVETEYVMDTGIRVSDGKNLVPLFGAIQETIVEEEEYKSDDIAELDKEEKETIIIAKSDHNILQPESHSLIQKDPKVKPESYPTKRVVLYGESFKEPIALEFPSDPNKDTVGKIKKKSRLNKKLSVTVSDVAFTELSSSPSSNADPIADGTSRRSVEMRDSELKKSAGNKSSIRRPSPSVRFRNHVEAEAPRESRIDSLRDQPPLSVSESQRESSIPRKTKLTRSAIKSTNLGFEVSPPAKQQEQSVQSDENGEQEFLRMSSSKSIDKSSQIEECSRTSASLSPAERPLIESGEPVESPPLPKELSGASSKEIRQSERHPTKQISMRSRQPRRQTSNLGVAKESEISRSETINREQPMSALVTPVNRDLSVRFHDQSDPFAHSMEQMASYRQESLHSMESDQLLSKRKPGLLVEHVASSETDLDSDRKSVLNPRARTPYGNRATESLYETALATKAYKADLDDPYQGLQRPTIQSDKPSSIATTKQDQSFVPDIYQTNRTEMAPKLSHLDASTSPIIPKSVLIHRPSAAEQEETKRSTASVRIRSDNENRVLKGIQHERIETLSVLSVKEPTQEMYVSSTSRASQTMEGKSKVISLREDRSNRNLQEIEPLFKKTENSLSHLDENLHKRKDASEKNGTSGASLSTFSNSPLLDTQSSELNEPTYRPSGTIESIQPNQSDRIRSTLLGDQKTAEKEGSLSIVGDKRLSYTELLDEPVSRRTTAQSSPTADLVKNRSVREESVRKGMEKQDYLHVVTVQPRESLDRAEILERPASHLTMKDSFRSDGLAKGRSVRGSTQNPIDEEGSLRIAENQQYERLSKTGMSNKPTSHHTMKDSFRSDGLAKGRSVRGSGQITPKEVGSIRASRVSDISSRKESFDSDGRDEDELQDRLYGARIPDKKLSTTLTKDDILNKDDNRLVKQSYLSVERGEKQERASSRQTTDSRLSSLSAQQSDRSSALIDSKTGITSLNEDRLNTTQTVDRTSRVDPVIKWTECEESFDEKGLHQIPQVKQEESLSPMQIIDRPASTFREIKSMRTDGMADNSLLVSKFQKGEKESSLKRFDDTLARGSVTESVSIEERGQSCKRLETMSPVHGEKNERISYRSEREPENGATHGRLSSLSLERAPSLRRSLSTERQKYDFAKIDTVGEMQNIDSNKARKSNLEDTTYGISEDIPTKPSLLPVCYSSELIAPAPENRAQIEFDIYETQIKQIVFPTMKPAFGRPAKDRDSIQLYYVPEQIVLSESGTDAIEEPRLISSIHTAQAISSFVEDERSISLDLVKSGEEQEQRLPERVLSYTTTTSEPGVRETSSQFSESVGRSAIHSDRPSDVARVNSVSTQQAVVLRTLSLFENRVQTEISSDDTADKGRQTIKESERTIAKKLTTEEEFQRLSRLSEKCCAYDPVFPPPEPMEEDRHLSGSTAESGRISTSKGKQTNEDEQAVSQKCQSLFRKDKNYERDDQLAVQTNVERGESSMSVESPAPSSCFREPHASPRMSSCISAIHEPTTRTDHVTIARDTDLKQLDSIGQSRRSTAVEKSRGEKESRLSESAERGQQHQIPSFKLRTSSKNRDSFREVNKQTTSAKRDKQHDVSSGVEKHRFSASAAKRTSRQLVNLAEQVDALDPNETDQLDHGTTFDVEPETTTFVVQDETQMTLLNPRENISVPLKYSPETVVEDKDEKAEEKVTDIVEINKSLSTTDLTMTVQEDWLQYRRDRPFSSQASKGQSTMQTAKPDSFESKNSLPPSKIEAVVEQPSPRMASSSESGVAESFYVDTADPVYGSMNATGQNALFETIDESCDYSNSNDIEKTKKTKKHKKKTDGKQNEFDPNDEEDIPLSELEALRDSLIALTSNSNIKEKMKNVSPLCPSRGKVSRDKWLDAIEVDTAFDLADMLSRKIKKSEKLSSFDSGGGKDVAKSDKDYSQWKDFRTKESLSLKDSVDFLFHPDQLPVQTDIMVNMAFTGESTQTQKNASKVVDYYVKEAERPHPTLGEVLQAATEYQGPHHVLALSAIHNEGKPVHRLERRRRVCREKDVQISARSATVPEEASNFPCIMDSLLTARTTSMTDSSEVLSTREDLPMPNSEPFAVVQKDSTSVIAEGMGGSRVESADSAVKRRSVGVKQRKPSQIVSSTVDVSECLINTDEVDKTGERKSTEGQTSQRGKSSLFTFCSENADDKSEHPRRDSATPSFLKRQSQTSTKGSASNVSPRDADGGNTIDSGHPAQAIEERGIASHLQPHSCDDRTTSASSLADPHLQLGHYARYEDDALQKRIASKIGTGSTVDQTFGRDKLRTSRGESRQTNKSVRKFDEATEFSYPADGGAGGKENDESFKNPSVRRSSGLTDSSKLTPDSQTARQRASQTPPTPQPRSRRSVSSSDAIVTKSVDRIPVDDEKKERDSRSSTPIVPEVLPRRVSRSSRMSSKDSRVGDEDSESMSKKKHRRSTTGSERKSTLGRDQVAAVDLSKRPSFKGDRRQRKSGSAQGRLRSFQQQGMPTPQPRMNRSSLAKLQSVYHTLASLQKVAPKTHVRERIIRGDRDVREEARVQAQRKTLLRRIKAGLPLYSDDESAVASVDNQTNFNNCANNINEVDDASDVLMNSYWFGLLGCRNSMS